MLDTINIYVFQNGDSCKKIGLYKAPYPWSVIFIS